VGVALIERVLRTLSAYSWKECLLIISPERFSDFELIAKKYNVNCIPQNEPNGTWDAVKQGLPYVSAKRVVICNGDMPLVSSNLIETLRSTTRPFGLVSTQLSNPQGYGRILRDEFRNFIGVKEDCELLGEESYIREVNAGLYACDVDALRQIELNISAERSEWFLTSIWKPKSVYSFNTEVILERDSRRVLGVNTWADFEQVEQAYYQIERENIVRQGAILQNCQHILITGKVNCEPGATLYGPCWLDGDVTIAHSAQIYPFSSVHDSTLASMSCIGPYAKLSSSVAIGEASVIGSFTDVKRSSIGKHTKIKHFAYMADTTCGSDCNIGAFVVTCNYNGKKKYSTLIEDHVFVGSSSQLIAPLTLHSYAYVGAGTTLTQSITSYTLVTRRADLKQRALRKQES